MQEIDLQLELVEQEKPKQDIQLQYDILSRKTDEIIRRLLERTRKTQQAS